MSNPPEQPSQLSETQLDQRIAERQADAITAARNARRFGVIAGILASGGFAATSIVAKLRPYSTVAMAGSLGATLLTGLSSERAAGIQERANSEAAPYQEEKFRRQLDASVQRNMQGPTRMPQAA